MKHKSRLDKKHRKSMQYRGAECLNCGHPLDKSDIYCPHCSQVNSEKQLSLKDFLVEFIGSILVYDSRLRHTLRDILFHPGRLTYNYVKGQRLKYANPFRFFLSVSIIFFLLNGIVAITPSHSEEANFLRLSTSDKDTISDSIETQKTPPIFNSISTRGDTVTARKFGISRYYSEKTLDTVSFFDEKLRRSAVYWEYHHHHPKMSAPEAVKRLNHQNSIKNHWLYERMIALKKIMENPQDFSTYLTSKIPFFLFFFTPLFAVFFWIVYSRKKYTYMEHMIFIFHIFSFIFLMKLLIIFLSLFISSTFLNSILIFIVGPLYFYLALRRFYLQSYIMTFFKFVFLNFVFIIGFLFAISIFLAGSVAVY